MNSLLLPVSIAEALDKFSILQIKLNRITDSERKKFVQDEIDAIYSSIKPYLKQFDYHYNCLLWINQEIWDLSDDVRKSDCKSILEIYERTFRNNDARFRVKAKLNLLTNSTLKEQKSYSLNTASFKVNSFEFALQYNSYIRYLTLCYDQIFLLTQDPAVKELFKDDPHIEFQTEPLGILIQGFPEPIPSLYLKYDFSYFPSIKE